ncbi:protein CrcB [Bifidobacterium commune]|uniref:Fluoride-specific ion channel FluC n=1 Tax=Bifidobacterium commune TaxID=1505727 RepID=A0A1C4GZJ6_9BIFI|nr:CrcB family protein [Bifidobacterium commune]MBB2955243.1 protein CrcB [Bifidobacterium commune]SCC78093.1 protein CrcB [Bifidobacterium commune]
MNRKIESAAVSSGAIILSLIAGGACGSLDRVVLSAFQSSNVLWPWITGVINLVGSFLLGCVTAYMSTLGPDTGVRKLVRLFLNTGLIGGFTTYSTFMLEVVKRLECGRTFIAFIYLFSCIIAGLVCAMVGFAAGKAMGQRRLHHPSQVKNSDETKAPHSTGLRSLMVMPAVFLILALVVVARNENCRRGEAVVALIAASLLGGLGAVARFGVDAWVNARIHLPFPCGTLVVNVTACLAMGFVSGWFGAHACTAIPLQYLLASGLLGGYSTFSTASVEGAKLFNDGHPWWALLYTGVMMLLSIAALFVGLVIQ